MASKTALELFAVEKGIKYFLVSFVDLFGNVRSKLVPASAIGQMERDGAGFAGFATYLDMTPAHPDMFAVPDSTSAIIVPWREGLAWVASDLVMDGKVVAQAPRNVLKAQIAKAKEAGYTMKTGVECEFFLLSEDFNQPSDSKDTGAKPCYDQGALMRRYEIITEICDYMQLLGWKPYQNDHEDANGQFEMNWEYDDCLLTADRHVFFKFMVKSIAEKHGFRATFMPKPLKDRTGNGAHAHVSLWEGEKNVFDAKAVGEEDEMGLSGLAYKFIGGVLENAEALCALTNPTVNSYKRIARITTLSGSSWAPQTISYTGNNRTHMLRIPDAGRFELRLPDGAVNPYLLQAALLAAGLDGIEKGISPGTRCDWNGHLPPAETPVMRTLPNNLLEALGYLKASDAFRKALGDPFIDSYVKLRMQQWEEYCGHLSQWELDNTLDC